MLDKFDKFMKQNKEIEPKTIKEIFPEDEKLYHKVESLIQEQKKKEEKIKQQLEQNNDITKNDETKNNTEFNKSLRKSAYKRQKK